MIFCFLFYCLGHINRRFVLAEYPEVQAVKAQSYRNRVNLGHAHTGVENNPILSVDFVLRKAASLSFLTYNKNRAVPKTCCATRCTANKLKQNRTMFFISCQPKQLAFKDTNSCRCQGISHWAIQLDHFSNKRKVKTMGTDIDQ